MERYTILVVEDDPAVARGLREGLEPEGYAVLWKTTVQDGLACVTQGLAHLVILDLRLPDGSGLTACREMRRRGLHQPVIILTAQSEETDKVLGLEMGADDYITKPFSLRELLSRVRAQLRRVYGEFAGGIGEVLLVGDLVIDPLRSVVTRGSRVLNLTPIEFRLLAYFAQNRGRALTREMIITAVWGHAPDLESDRAVNVHVRRLREKVELNPAWPELILTVPGVGYRLKG